MRIGLLVVCLTWLLCGIGYADEATSFGNEDVNKTRGIFKSERIKSDTQKSTSKKVSSKDGKSLKKTRKPSVDKKEEKIVDSFVVLSGNRKYHLKSCKQANKGFSKLSTLSGAKVISGRYSTCGLCKPKAYKDAKKEIANRKKAKEVLKKKEDADKKVSKEADAKKKNEKKKKNVPKKSVSVVPKTISTESGK